MMGAILMENGKGVYLMAKVMNIISKLGVFKVKGEKPRVGYFQDNVMISESRQKDFKQNEPITR